VKKVGGQLAPAAIVALALHAVAFGWLAAMPKPPPPRVRLPPGMVKLATRPPAPKPAPAPERVARAVVTPRPQVLPDAPPPSPAPQPQRPAPKRFAVSMEATVPGGGVAVPTTEGATAARGRADLPANAPVGDNTGPTAPVDVVEVERAPRPIRQPSAAELRALYPEQARREQLEMDVPMQLLVDAEGKVADARVLRPIGTGFDEAAIAAARGILFRPAERGGRPIAVRIPWTMKFRLDS
jgi:protein TonB